MAKQETPTKKGVTMYRQGDILIVAVDAIPAEAKSQPSLILAEGEATGHHHRLSGGQVVARADELYFTVAEPTDLTHQEHDTITIPVGSWQVIRQREYSPKEIRRVAD